MHLFLTLMRITGYSKISAAIFLSFFFQFPPDLKNLHLMILNKQSTHNLSCSKVFRVSELWMWTLLYPPDSFTDAISATLRLHEEEMSRLFFLTFWCTTRRVGKYAWCSRSQQKKPDINNSVQLWDIFILCPLRPSLLSWKIKKKKKKNWKKNKERRKEGLKKESEN